MATKLKIEHFNGEGEAVIDGSVVAQAADLDEITDANGNEILEFDTVASAVTYVRVANAATANNPVISAQGEDDTGLEFHTASDEEMLILEAVAAGVNEITITNAATGNNPTIACTGEADTGITLQNSEGEEILILDSIATSVNEITISSAATGSGPQVAATGGDTNVNLELIPKGTGYVDVQGGLQNETQTLTANTDEGTGSSVEDGTRQVNVSGVTTDANDFIVLPAIANVPLGHTITVCCNASSNFEVRTPSTSGTTINGVDSDGTQEYLATDTDTIVFTKALTTGWIGVSYTSAGAVRTAVIPD